MPRAFTPPTLSLSPPIAIDADAASLRLMPAVRHYRSRCSLFIAMLLRSSLCRAGHASRSYSAHRSSAAPRLFFFIAAAAPRLVARLILRLMLFSLVTLFFIPQPLADDAILAIRHFRSTRDVFILFSYAISLSDTYCFYWYWPSLH